MIPKLKDLLEATEDDKYTHIGYGKYKLKKDVDSDGKSKKGSPTFKKDKESGDYKKITGGADSGKKKEKPKGQGLSGDDFKRNGDEKPDKPKKAVQIPALNKIHKYFNIKFYLYQENLRHHLGKPHSHFWFDKFQLRRP